MKTDDLIALLASDPLPPQGRPRWQSAAAVLAAVALALLAVRVMGINPLLADTVAVPSIAIKVLWLAVLMVTAIMAVRQLARPGFRLGGTRWIWPAAWLAMAALAVFETWGGGAPSAQTNGAALWLGSSWKTCSLTIVALSMPLLGALIWTLRDRAPTQPAWAGGVAGLVAGSVTAMVYSLHCTETGFGFFTLWYGAGIALSSLIGAACGRHWLRW